MLKLTTNLEHERTLRNLTARMALRLQNPYPNEEKAKLHKAWSIRSEAVLRNESFRIKKAEEMEWGVYMGILNALFGGAMEAIKSLDVTDDEATDYLACANWLEDKYKNGFTAEESSALLAICD